MSLRSDLQTMGLPDVLQWIAAGRKTGTLHMERASVQKRIIVRDGNISSSWSNDPRESLGQFLIRLNLVTEEELFKALLAQEEQNELIGSLLLADGSPHGVRPQERAQGQGRGDALRPVPVALRASSSSRRARSPRTSASPTRHR